MTLGILNFQKNCHNPLRYLPNHEDRFVLSVLFLLLRSLYLKKKPKEMPIFTATLALGSVSGSLSFLSQLFTTTNDTASHNQTVSSLFSPISNYSKHSLRYCCGSRRTPWVCSASNASGNTETNGQAGPVLQDSPVSNEAIRQARVRFVFVFGFNLMQMLFGVRTLSLELEMKVF